MRHIKSLLIMSLFAAATAQAGAAGTPALLKLGQQSYTYTCTGKQVVQVTYVTTGGEHDGKPVFLVLTYKGKSYGLAEAVSASGSRYVGHAGMNMNGIEWWEHQGEGTLSTFKGDNASDAKALLTCKI